MVLLNVKSFYIRKCYFYDEIYIVMIDIDQYKKTYRDNIFGRIVQPYIAVTLLREVRLIYMHSRLHLPVKVRLQDAYHSEMLFLQLLFDLRWSLIT